jgi:peroxiredoxin
MTTTIASTAPRRGLRPRQPAPSLELPLLGGGVFRLAERRPERFTMVVFFRGLHCPVCRAQLTELDRRLDELSARGVDVIAVSAETRERSEQLQADWKLERLPIAYGLAEPSMREWGLFVSRGRSDDEPALFNEPGLFLIEPDGTVYYESILSMPAGRPRLDDLLAGIDYWTKVGYPARGDA